ncbi:MAG: segregation/condensation protein A [Actinomycetota bacterium]
MAFQVKIEVFEGPFDLLLQLIMKQELEISEVPVAVITQSFLEHMEAMPKLDLDTATEFLLIAATLLLIKARALIPPAEDLEGAEEPEQAREFLLEKLIEYRQFASVAEVLGDRYAEHGWYLPRSRELEVDYASLYPDPFEGVIASELAATMVELLLQSARAKVDTSYIAPIRVSVRERLEEIRGLLAKGGQAMFTQIVASCGSKIEVIATFLAILELCKRGEVTLKQKRLFGDIEIKSREEAGSAA